MKLFLTKCVKHISWLFHVSIESFFQSESNVLWLFNEIEILNSNYELHKRRTVNLKINILNIVNISSFRCNLISHTFKQPLRSFYQFQSHHWSLAYPYYEIYSLVNSPSVIPDKILTKDFP